MKKVMTLFCAAAIASTPFAGIAQASTSANTIETEAGAEQAQEEQVRDLTVLTLEDVLKRGLENDKSILLLEYQLEASANQVLSTKDDKRDAQKEIKDLDETLDRLKENRDLLRGGERAAVYDGIEAYEDQVTALENAIKQLESGQATLNIQTEGIKEALTLQLTSSYMNLLSLQDQIAFTKTAIQSAADNVRKAERLYDYGMGSKDDIDQAKREQVDLEKQLEQKEKDYYYNLAALTLDIDVNYNPDVKLTQIEMDIQDSEAVLSKAIANAMTRAADQNAAQGPETSDEKAVESDETAEVITEEQEIDLENYEVLIENTFKMMEAKENLELAKYNRDEVYADDDSDQFDKQAEDYNVKIAEEQIVQLREQLTKKIDTLKHNIKTSKFNYEEALRKLKNAQTDIQNLEKRYRLGVVSKHDYEQAQLQLDQLELNVEISKTNYFLVQQSIEALGKGYIQ